MSHDKQPRPARTITARLRYRFDLALSRGPLIIIGYVGAVMLVIILVSASLLPVLRLAGVNGDPHGLSFAEAFWQALLRVIDTGTIASDQDWATRAISFVVTLSGIFLAGSLIGLIANAVDQRIDHLRKGRSEVLEDGHTLVLGWSERLPVILSELVIANENQRRQSVVVLADRAKDEMEDELHRLVPNTRTTRVVCRTGDTGSIDDLRLVNIEGARAVIVLAGADGDPGVVKALLAVRSIDPDLTRLRVVAELLGADHAEALRVLTDRRIATVRADEVISQVTAQACHQSGLAGVFRDLIDFDGDEIYFSRVPELTGHTYRQALLAFPDSSVIGMLRDGRTQLNPPGDTVFAEGDEVIVVAADDDRVVFGGFQDVQVGAVSGALPFAEPARRVVIVGWSPLGETVLRELDQFLGTGSVVDLLIDTAVLAADEVVLPACANCTVELHALPAHPQPLVDIVTARDYDEAIVLGYRHKLTPAQADTRSMLTLLALHKAWRSHGRRPRIVAEMLDRSNVAVAQTTGADDFIVSDELSSLMIAQLSERLELQDVFAELFDTEGSFISLRPAGLYATTTATTYAHVVAAAAQRGESALGYRIGETVVLNPAKVTPLTFGADDQVLVLGQRAGRPPTAPALAGVLDASPAPGLSGPALLDQD
jgi:Trk K+ transport system NAD-binding subunit